MKQAVQVRYTPDGWETTEIDFADFERMQTGQHCSPRSMEKIPDFALDNKKLRMVIVERDRVHANFTLKSFRRTHVEGVRRAGSYRAFLGGIAYRAWRLGWDSPTIALEMHVSPGAVRQHLFRMVEVARELEARGWIPEVPEYIEGEVCWSCRKRPVDKARNKWRCTECLDEYNACERLRMRRKRLAA